MTLRFEFRWRHMTDGLEQLASVEPIHPFERGVFHCVQRSPGAASLDHLGREHAVDGFGRGAGVFRVAHRGLLADGREPRAVSIGQTLDAPVAVVNERVADLTGVQRLLQDIRGHFRVRRLLGLLTQRPSFVRVTSWLSGSGSPVCRARTPERLAVWRSQRTGYHRTRAPTRMTPEESG